MADIEYARYELELLKHDMDIAKKEYEETDKSDEDRISFLIYNMDELETYIKFTERKIKWLEEFYTEDKRDIF